MPRCSSLPVEQAHFCGTHRLQAIEDQHTIGPHSEELQSLSVPFSHGVRRSDSPRGIKTLQAHEAGL
jgi:hypothetical protein